MSNNSQNKIIPMRQSYNAKVESEKNTFGKRLAEARHKKRLTLNALVQELSSYGIHVQTSAISKWEKGSTTPNPYQFFALCRILDIEDGVRYFSGPLHPGETVLNEEGLKKVEEYKKDLIDSENYKIAESLDNYEEEIDYPIQDLAVSAGLGNFLDNESYHMESFQKSTVPYKADFALRVSGDSMMPNYTDGQIVWVQKTPELYSGEIGIFILNECGYMKKYIEKEPDEEEMEEYCTYYDVIKPKIELVSLNKKYDPIVIGEYDDFRIVGRVLTK